MRHIFSFCCGLLCFVGFSACTVDAGMKITPLHAENIISKLGDSIFLSKQIPCIDSRHDTIYLSDYHAGVYSLDKNLNLIKKVSTIGLGQGEVNRLAQLFAGDDVCVLFNEGSQRYSYFSGNSFLKNDSKTVGYNLAFASRFFVKGDSIYQDIINDDFLVSVTKDGNTIKKICPIVKNVDRPDNVALSERHLVKGDNSFYVIGRGLPIIQEYSYDGKELAYFDLSSIPILANAYEKNMKLKMPNSYYVIVEDAYFKYSTFCINDKNECIAVCKTNGTIEVYRLPI